MIAAENGVLQRKWFAAYPGLLLAALVIYVAARPILHAINHHIMLESDSVAYLALGVNIWNGKGFVDYTGQWCSDWPPFYPFVIGLAAKICRDPVIAIGIVNAFCLAATTVLVFVWAGKITKSLLIQSVTTATTALSYPLTNLANSGLSEILFIPLALGAVLSINYYIETGKKKLLILSSLLALICCLTRYIGVTVIAASLITLLLSSSELLRKKISDSAIYIIVVLPPLFGWCLLNKIYTESWMGSRDPGDHTVFECWIALIDCLRYALIDKTILYIVLGLILIGLIIAARKHALSKQIYIISAALFAVFYAAILVWSSATYSIDMVDDRLTAPLFAPLVLVAAALFEYLKNLFVVPARATLSTLFIALLLVVIYGSDHLPQVPDGGYLSSTWRNSPTLKYLKNADLNSPVFSNDSSAAYLFAQKSTSDLADDSDTPTMTYVESEMDTVPTNGYVVWLYNGLEPSNFSPGTIASNCPVKIIAKFNDGVIFRRKDGGQLAASSL